MENQAMLFFVAILTGVAVENVVFTRALGLSKTVMLMNRPGMGILYGALLTWMLTVSSVFVGITNQLLAGTAYASTLAAPLYLLSVCGVYALTHQLTKRKLPELFAIIERALPIIAFGTALFGAFFVALVRNLNILQTIGYSLGTGIGYTLALLIIYYARKRLAISPVPRSFRGLPILLLYIGFLSLALYGLIGHGLPT